MYWLINLITTGWHLDNSAKPWIMFNDNTSYIQCQCFSNEKNPFSDYGSYGMVNVRERLWLQLINCWSVAALEPQPHAWKLGSPHPHPPLWPLLLTLHLIKDTLLPAWALDVSTEHNSWHAELSNMNLNIWLYYVLMLNKERKKIHQYIVIRY